MLVSQRLKSYDSAMETVPFSNGGSSWQRTEQNYRQPRDALDSSRQKESDD